MRYVSFGDNGGIVDHHRLTFFHNLRLHKLGVIELSFYLC